MLQMAREMNLRNSLRVGASGAAAPVPSLWALKRNHGWCLASSVTSTANMWATRDI